MKELKSELVSYVDNGFRVIKRLAEVIQDAGGDPDQDLIQLATDENLARHVGKLVVKSLFPELGFKSQAPWSTEYQKVIDSLKPFDNEIMNKRPHTVLDGILSSSMTKINRIEGTYHLISPRRLFPLLSALKILNNQEYKVTSSHELITMIPALRAFILENFISIRVYSGANLSDKGLVYECHVESKSEIKGERIMDWEGKETLSSDRSFILVRKPLLKNLRG